MREKGLGMTEQSGTPVENRIRVRVVAHSVTSSLQAAINAALEEEYAKGAEVVNISLASTPPVEYSSPGMTTLTSPRGEHVALILLRPGRGGQ
jgi:hypothetical protein